MSYYTPSDYTLSISTIDNLGYTFCSSNLPLDFTETTVEAYTAVYDKDKSAVVLNRVYKVPANTGLFIMGEADDIPVLTGEADDVEWSSNVLKPVASTTTIYQIDGSNTNFVLGVDNALAATKAIFLKAPTEGVSVSGGKAYLQIPTDDAPTDAARIAVTFNDEAAGISEVRTHTAGASGYYNLNGQRVAQPGRGLYIQDGRKYMAK